LHAVIDDIIQGNEGNEGNEGDEGNEGSAAYEDASADGGTDIAYTYPKELAFRTVAAPATASPVAKVPGAGTDGRYKVCVPTGTKSWGPVTGPRPEGISVSANGLCVISEFAGNDDGFYQPYAGDGHEPVYKKAVNQMLKAGACVGMECGKDNPKNKYLDGFFAEMNKLAGVKDYDYKNVRIMSLWVLRAARGSIRAPPCVL
jgi:hypothetical protein